MLVRLSEPVSIVTPPLALILSAGWDLYHTTGWSFVQRGEIRVGWESVKRLLLDHLIDMDKDNYRLVCDETTNPPTIAAQQKIRLQLSMKTSPRPEFYCSRFTISRVETDVLDVAEFRVTS